MQDHCFATAQIDQRIEVRAMVITVVVGADVARGTRRAAGNCRIDGVPLEALQARARLAVRVSVAVPRARPALS